MERHPFSIAEWLAGSKAQEVPAIGSAPQVPPELLGSNMLPSCILLSYLWNQPQLMNTDEEGSASSSSPTSTSSSIDTLAGTNPGTRGYPVVDSTPQALVGLLRNSMLPSFLPGQYFWNQPNEIPKDVEGSALSPTTTPTVFAIPSAGSNKDHQQGRSSKQIKRLLLDKRNRQKAKLIPQPALVPGTPECEHRYEEAMKHYQSLPVQKDTFLSILIGPCHRKSRSEPII
ncbi:unnamed protein product [Caenorhabditis nigoni]